MSASKGLGASAKEVSDMLPPTLVRLLMIRKLPNQPIDFDPEGTTVPTLFDEYDRLADHEFKRHPNADLDYARTFELCQVDFPKKPKDLWQMRFSIVSFVVQMPHLSLLDEAEKLKSNPLSEDEKNALEERAYYVKLWLEKNAPAEYRYAIKEESTAIDLSDKQRGAMKLLHDALRHPDLEWTGPAIHSAIHAVKEETGIEPKELFQPLYQMLLGRNSGPQMGWFLSTFPRENITQRLASVVS